MASYNMAWLFLEKDSPSILPIIFCIQWLASGDRSGPGNPEEYVYGLVQDRRNSSVG